MSRTARRAGGSRALESRGMLEQRGITLKRLAFASLFYAALAFGAAPDAFLIVPGQGIGPLRAGMTRAELQKLLKAQELAEGDDGGKPALSAYFMDPKKRIALHLDAQGKIRGMTMHGNASVWHDARGISLGASLATLEKLNGKPFRVHSFDDSQLSGRILDWDGGALAKTLVKVTLTFASPMHASGYSSLSGAQKEGLEKPRDLLSSAPELRALNPIVETIELTF